MTTIKDRLLEFISYKGLNKNKFEKKIGRATGFVNNIGEGINVESLDKIRKVFPELSSDWLLSGKGKMLNDDIFKITRTREEESLEIIELRANVDILLEYVLKLRAEVHQKDLKKVVDEYDFDFEKQLRKLKS
jgi:ribosome-associated translation inhibitor RaiA